MPFQCTKIIENISGSIPPDLPSLESVPLPTFWDRLTPLPRAMPVRGRARHWSVGVSTPGELKSLLDRGGNRTRDLCFGQVGSECVIFRNSVSSFDISKLDWQTKGRGFDSHRGQANFSACPVRTHSEQHHKHIFIRYLIRISLYVASIYLHNRIQAQPY